MALTTIFDAAFIRTTESVATSQRLLDTLHRGISASDAQIAAARETIHDSMDVLRQTNARVVLVKRP